MSLRSLSCAAVVLMCFGSAASADFQKVNDKSRFIDIIEGKTLTYPLVRLRVTEDGRIEGIGARWEITGDWTWRDGYFCRNLFWGGDEIGYNCQEVRVNDNRVRFTSDRGEGQSAVFRLR